MGGDGRGVTGAEGSRRCARLGPEDDFNPTYCVRCKQRVPDAVSSANNGLCHDCAASLAAARQTLEQLGTAARERSLGVAELRRLAAAYRDLGDATRVAAAEAAATKLEDAEQRAAAAVSSHYAFPVQGKRKCPYCAEKVRWEAIKCKHCGEDLKPAGPGEVITPSSFTGAGVASAFLLIAGLAVVAYYLLIFDPSVPAGDFGRVNNTGLLQDRQNGILVGGGMAFAGLLLALFDRRHDG